MDPLKCHLKCFLPQQKPENITTRTTRWRTSSGDTPHVTVKAVVAQSCDSFEPMDCSPPGPFVHGDSPGKNAAVGCHVLLQGIFPTQGSNRGLQHCRRILHRLSHRDKNKQTNNSWARTASQWGTCDPIIVNFILL